MKTSFAVSALLYLSFDQVKALRLAPAGKAKALAQVAGKAKVQAKFVNGWNPDMVDDGAWMSPGQSMA